MSPPATKNGNGPNDRTGLLAAVCLGCLTAVLLATSGCEGDDARQSSAGSHPFAGQTVTIAAPKELGLSDAWKPVLDEWSEQTGAKCQLVEYSSRAPQAADPPSGDAIILPFSELGAFAAADRLGRIPQAQFGNEATRWLDFFSGLREHVLSLGGAPSLIPISCPVLVCYLRRDLLERSGLKPPETWEDYQALVDASAQWAPGLSVVEPWGPDFRATMFLARALPLVKHPASYSVFFDIESGAPLIDSPGFVRALEQALAATSKMPADVKNLTPEDCRRLVLSGKAAMAITMEPGRGGEKGTERAHGISLSFVRLPGSRQLYNRRSKIWESPSDQDVNYATLAPFAGLAAAVSHEARGANADAAWNLIGFLATNHYEQAFRQVDKSVCRESQLSGSIPWMSADLRSDELPRFLGAVAESLRSNSISAELAVIGHSQFRQALSEGLTAALEGKQTPEAALKSVAERWRAIESGLGAERVRDSYRKCLGLPPAVKVPSLKESDEQPISGSVDQEGSVDQPVP
jgi:multiple sugar transport system substrate-binding protein